MKRILFIICLIFSGCAQHALLIAGPDSHADLDVGTTGVRMNGGGPLFYCRGEHCPSEKTTLELWNRVYKKAEDPPSNQ